MKPSFKTFKSAYTASAKVVDGKLVFSLPGAVTPVVWQMDLDNVKASALQVITDKDGALHILALKTPKGESTDIAAFEKREAAVQALMAASHALENAHGKIRSPAAGTGKETGRPDIPYTMPAKRSGGSKWGIVLAVVFIVILIGIWGSLSMSPQTTDLNAARSTSPAETSPENRTGVPLSADDFLRRPR